MIRWNAAPAVLIAVLISVPAFAQGGGASSTGTIQGRVADAQGAVLPGVTVTATRKLNESGRIPRDEQIGRAHV